MKKRMIKNLLLVVVMAVLCVAVGMTASALEPTGQCGDNVYWTFDETTGELVISGSGDMWDNENGPFQFGNVTNVIIESGVTSIGDFAFEECDSLKELTLGEDLVSIGKESFRHCISLEELNIPDSVEYIDDYAFRYCYNLKYIKIGKGLNDIGKVIFDSAEKVTEVFVDEENKAYSSDEFGVLFNKDKTELILYPVASKNSIYKIPDSVEGIRNNAFMGALYLLNVELPENLRVIDDMAFAVTMFAFDEIHLSKNVEKVGEGAFFSNPFLKKIYIEGMHTDLNSTYPFGFTEYYIKDGISKDEFAEKYIGYYETSDESLLQELFSFFEFPEETYFIGTIYCHAGSTAEAYAIENGMEYVLTHFFEGEWSYDYDNMIRYRKCIHCDELETEALETTGDGEVDIIAPTNPDTDFTVDVVEDYVVIEETISNNITTDFEIVKAFDINLKNKDGVHVQPDGTVKVKLPLDWSKDGVYKVYRVNDDGTLTDMNAYRQGSHMVFDTDHFSIYVIVDESEKTDAPVIPDEPQEETKDNFFTRLLDLIKSFFDLIMSWFKK